MIEILSFPKLNTLSSLSNIQLFGDAEADIVVLISHAVIVFATYGIVKLGDV
jgi:hypothetical protein